MPRRAEPRSLAIAVWPILQYADRMEAHHRPIIGDPDQPATDFYVMSLNTVTIKKSVKSDVKLALILRLRAEAGFGRPQ
jgi:hypothetical protein